MRVRVRARVRVRVRVRVRARVRLVLGLTPTLILTCAVNLVTYWCAYACSSPRCAW